MWFSLCALQPLPLFSILFSPSLLPSPLSISGSGSLSFSFSLSPPSLPPSSPSAPPSPSPCPSPFLSPTPSPFSFLPFFFQDRLSLCLCPPLWEPQPVAAHSMYLATGVWLCWIIVHCNGPVSELQGAAGVSGADTRYV